MNYLNTKALESVDADSFLHADPFPWINPHGFLTDEGFFKLASDYPDISLFEKDFGRMRKFGQPPHNRYRLHYPNKKNSYPQAWKDFIAELHGPVYTAFARRLLGVDKFHLRMEWHYTPGGAEVTPHLDGHASYATHLFFFNTKKDWDPSWGGQTLILKPKPDTHLSTESNPTFGDFIVHEAQVLENYSVLFKNQDNAWHGVKKLTSPDGVLRKLFSIFISKPIPVGERIKQLVRKKFASM